MSKIGSHDPFGYFKHKLWPKEGLGVKLAIWLPTTKSRESPWFTFVQVTCHILLKSFQRGLQLCFRPHLNQRFSQEVMSFQSLKSLNFWNFGTPKLTWKSWDKMTFGHGPYGQTKKKLWGGESCEFVFAHGSSMHQNCLNYTLTNLLFGLCRFVWIIDLLVIHLSPHPRAPAHPSTPKMLWVREQILTHYPSVVFTFGFRIESIKEFGGVSQWHTPLSPMYFNL